jgi:lactoylglutathione lyase
VSRVVHSSHRVRDLEASLAWYGRLGFEKFVEMVPEDEDGVTVVFLGLGESEPRLELWHEPGFQEWEPGRGYRHIGIAVEDLDATLETLRAHGIEPTGPPFEPIPDGARICFLRDPDGFEVELLENYPFAALP